MGLWTGNYQNQHQCWLRWWDQEGNLLLFGDERAQAEKQRADSLEKSRKDAIPKLLSMGLTVEQVAQALSLSLEEVIELS